MRLAPVLIAALAGLTAGFTLTAFIVDRGISFDAQQLGIWEFVPRIGAADMDPYRRAHLFAAGELPLASGEGLVLRTGRDQDGLPLRGDCRYRFTGPVPAARYWTLVLNTPDGQAFANPAGRNGFTSAEIVRVHGGGFAIEIGPQALAGNWLPSPPGRPFTLIVRLYETPLSAAATKLDAANLPVLTRLGCPP